MAVIIPPGFRELIFRFSEPGLGSNPVVVLGIQDPPSLSELANNMTIWAEDVLYEMLGDEYTLVDIVAQSQTDQSIFPLGLVGQRVIKSAPPNCATLVRKSTGLRGRSERGRSYWPGCLAGADILEGGVIDPTVFIDRVNRFTNLFNRLAGVGADMVLLHSSSSDPTPVTSYDVDALIATQRRRLR